MENLHVGQLREELLECLQDSELRKEIVQAVLREATGAAKTTNVLKAFDMLTDMLDKPGAEPEAVTPGTDFSILTDAQLRRLLGEEDHPRGITPACAGKRLSCTCPRQLLDSY